MNQKRLLRCFLRAFVIGTALPFLPHIVGAVPTPIYSILGDYGSAGDDIFVFGPGAGNSVSLDSTTTNPPPPEGLRSMRSTALVPTNFGSTPPFAPTWAVMFLNPNRTNRPVDLSAYGNSNPAAGPVGEMRFWAYCTSDNFETVVQHFDGSQDGCNWSHSSDGTDPNRFLLNQWNAMACPADFYATGNLGTPKSIADVVSPFALIMNADPSAAMLGTCYIDDVRYVNPPAPSSEMFDVAIKNISDQQPATQLTWLSPDPSSGWARSNQYIELQTDSETMGWGVQIYTTNMGAGANPSFSISNSSSNPAGLINVGDPHYNVPLAWSIKAGTQIPSAAAPSAAEPNDNGGPCSSSGIFSAPAFQWLYMQDVQTPAVSGLCQNSFQNGNAFSVVRNNLGIHFGQAPGEFGAAISPSYIFFEANFGVGFAQQTYTTNSLIVEYFYY